MNTNLKPETLNQKPDKVVAYGRGSTEKQENTIETQENGARHYCVAHGKDLSRYFPDSGTSGSTTFMERPAVVEMLAYMEAEDRKGVSP